MVPPMSTPWHSHPQSGTSLRWVRRGWRGCHWLFIYAKIRNVAEVHQCCNLSTGTFITRFQQHEGGAELGDLPTSSSIRDDGISTHLTVVSWLLQRALHRANGFWLAVCARGISHTKLLRAGIITKTIVTKTIADTACRTLALIVNNKLRCIGKTITKVKQNSWLPQTVWYFPDEKKKTAEVRLRV